MIWIVSFVLCVVVCGCIGLYGLATWADEDGTIAVVAAVVLFIVWAGGHTLFASFANVGSGELGIEYGVSGVIDGQVGPGTHFIAPWASVTTVNAKTQKVTFANLDTFSKESQNVFITAVVNYHLDPQAIQNLYRTVGPSWFDTLIPARVNEDVKDATVKYYTTDIAPHREDIRLTVRDHLRKDLAPYSIYVDDVLIQNVDYSAQFKASIESKQVASQNAQRAKLQADQVRAEAAGQRDAAIIKAQGQAQANNLVSRSLNSRILQFEAIQKLNPNVKVILPSGASIYNLGNVTGK